MYYTLSTWGEDGQFVSPTISGNNFSEFLELCYENSTYFSLNKAPWDVCTCTNLQTALERFLVKEITTFKWFGYDYTAPPRPDDQRNIEVYLYSANIETKNIIIKYCHDIFLRTAADGTLLSNLETVEDLCFFTQKTLFVGTVSHESIISISPPNIKFEYFMKKLGKWNSIDQSPICLQ